MLLQGTYDIEASREHVWTLLDSKDTLVEILPGCKSLERLDEDTFEGLLGASVGPVKSEYKTTIKILERNFPDRYALEINGKGKGGMVHGGMNITLDEREGGGTTVHYSGDARVSGKIARVGQRLIDVAATITAKLGLKSLARIAEADPQAREADPEKVDGPENPDAPEDVAASDVSTAPVEAARGDPK